MSASQDWWHHNWYILFSWQRLINRKMSTPVATTAHVDTGSQECQYSLMRSHNATYLFLASNSVATVSPAFFLIQRAKTCNCHFHWSRSNRTRLLCGLHLTNISFDVHHVSKTHQAVPLLTFYCCTGEPWEWGYKPSSSHPFMFSELVHINWWSIILLVERKSGSWYPEFSCLHISV